MKKLFVFFTAAFLLLGANSLQANYYPGGKEKQKKASQKPSHSAKRSAKGAVKAMRVTQSQIMARAKVRNYFHRMFNAKTGQTRNFRRARTRARYNRGR